MKQQVNPVIIAVVAVVLIGLIGFFGWKSSQPAVPTGDSKADASAPAAVETVNGQKVPPGVPADLVQRAKQMEQQQQQPTQR